MEINKTPTLLTIIDDTNTIIRTLDVTEKRNLEAINMLSRAREIYQNVDRLFMQVDKPQENTSQPELTPTHVKDATD